MAITGCGFTTVPALHSGTAAPAFANPLSRLKTPALIAVDNSSGNLEYWPVRPHGGDRPRVLASLGVVNDEAMAADGDVVAIANYSPAEVVTYDVRTRTESILPDPYGSPIDVAIDKNGSIYALDSTGSVVVYGEGSSQPTELTCSYVNAGVGIAVNDEGNVLVDAYGPRHFLGVVEFATGSSHCTKLSLRPQRGSLGGIRIDPKTDDLIVLDNPDTCAGGSEGRLTVYRKPYAPTTARRHYIQGAVCPGEFILDAGSTHIFVSDTTISQGVALIDQRSYPSGRGRAVYEGGNFGGFTTIPNTLPN